MSVLALLLMATRTALLFFPAAPTARITRTQFSSEATASTAISLEDNRANYRTWHFHLKILVITASRTTKLAKYWC